MSKYAFDYVNDFTGGENSFASPDQLISGQLMAAENIELFGVGGFKRRTGISSYKTLGVNRIDRLIEYEYRDFGTKQVETVTVAGTITTAGNATVIVTAVGMMNSPKTINVAVALNDTASQVATKIVTALQADANINGFFTISVSSAVITFTARTAVANDSTMNISIANGTCVGLTAAPTSTNTTAGVAPVADNILIRLALTNNQLINWDTGTVLKTGLSRHCDYAIYKYKLYILSNNQFLVYDGNTITDVTNANADSGLLNIKKCKYIEQRGERLFAAGNPDDANALYYSETGDPTYWKLTNVVQAITADADRITGLKEYHGALLAFKERAVYAWFGYNPTTDVEFKRLSVHTGTRAYRSIVPVGDSLFYLGSDGVYALLGTYENVIVTNKVSKNITDRVKKVLHSEYHYLDSACAVYRDGKYMLSVACGTDEAVNDTVLVFFKELINDKEESWVVNTGWNISDWLPSLDGKLYSASSITGVIHRHDEIYNDMGAGISIRADVRPLSQDAPVHNKKYRRGYIAFQQQDVLNSHLTIHVTIDGKEEITTVTPDDSLVWDDTVTGWDNAKWDFSEFVTRRININQKGKRIMISMRDDTVDELTVVYGFAIEYKIKKPDRG